MANSKHANEYDAAMVTFRNASASYRAAARKYRAREIGDEEFLAARRAFDAAQATMDRAETSYIAACNETGEQ